MSIVVVYMLRLPTSIDVVIYRECSLDFDIRHLNSVLFATSALLDHNFYHCSLRRTMEQTVN